MITEIQILPIKPRDGLLAFASFVFNDSIFVGNVAVHSRPDGSGYRLVYPSKALPNGKVINVVHPINQETGRAISQAVAGRFEEVVRKSGKTFETEQFIWR